MTKPIDTSRREFLRNASLLSVAGTITTPFALNLFAMNSAFAAPVSDYKALVCLYLAGGNDSANMIFATDGPSWAGYMAARGGSINIMPTGTLLNITPNQTAGIEGRTLALHPNMEDLQTLFTSGRAAIVANVGTLIEPIANTSEYRGNTKIKPPNLFSHSDQTSQWLTANPSSPYFGWAGRMADQHAASNNHSPFANISLSGNSIFLAGETVTQYQLGSNGDPVGIAGMTNLFGTSTSNNPLGSIITNANGTGAASNVFEKDHAAVVQRSIAAQAKLADVMDSNAVHAPTIYNPLATQLQTVASIIAGRSKLDGVRRQVFFVTLGGFDTHNGQRDSHGALMARLSHAVKYFDDELKALSGDAGFANLAEQVTLFTASDFGRTFASNGSGTDHGWGGHHIVVGGAVRGNTVYGTFPPTCVDGALDSNGNRLNNPLDAGSGALIPTTSVEQYAATLASWFGFTADEINALFPNLDPLRFSPPYLGFMK